MTSPTHLTVRQFAEAIGLKPATVQEHIQKGKLAAIKIPEDKKSYRITWSVAQKWARQNGRVLKL